MKKKPGFPPGDPIERFWKKVDKGDGTGCFLWTGAKSSSGYGNFMLLDQRIVLAHRAAWELFNGNIPEGGCVLHRCDVPLCVRTSHLFLGSLSDNAIDMYEKRRRVHVKARYGNSRYTIQDIEEMKNLRDHGLTQSEIGELYGTSQSYVSQVFRGKLWGE